MLAPTRGQTVIEIVGEFDAEWRRMKLETRDLAAADAQVPEQIAEMRVTRLVSDAQELRGGIPGQRHAVSSSRRSPDSRVAFIVLEVGEDLELDAHFSGLRVDRRRVLILVRPPRRQSKLNASA
jgi:hypothetical protein